MIAQVWAPRAARVELVAAGGGPMQAGDDGWWRAPVDLPHGADYAFALGGGPPRPDPRSSWQPAGVHGPSRVFDPHRFVWSDAGWPGRDARGALVYELHVGTFTPAGTLDAAAQRLDHLVDLGAEVVELMPLAAFNGVRGWGYDGVALFAVHEPYGGPAALQRFVDTAHGRGLAVCLDVVYNHLGPSGNYLAEFGPYFTTAHSTPWGDAVNLDGPGSDQVRRFVIANALRWFTDFHLDALRLDAVQALYDNSPRHLLAELSDRVATLAAQLGRPLSLVAESDLNDPVVVTATRDDGLGMTAQWDDDLHHAVHALVTGERQGYYVDFGSPDVLRQVLRRVFRHDGGWSTFRGRPWGAPVPDAVDGHRFVVCAQDHDQVGNRALGDRPSARLDPGALAAAAALVLCSPFTPMVFMGEEWGASTPFQFFTDHPEPDLARAVRAGRAAEFADHGTDRLGHRPVPVPDPQDPATFERSRLDWAEPGRQPHARLLAWYRTLAALRRDVRDLRSGDRSATDLLADPQAGTDGPYAGWLVLARGDARVVVNLRHAPCAVPVPPAARELGVAASWAGATPQGAGWLLPARSVAVLVPTSPL